MSIYQLLGLLGLGAAIVVLSKMINKMDRDELQYNDIRNSIPEDHWKLNRPGSYVNRIARFYNEQRN